MMNSKRNHYGRKKLRRYLVPFVAIWLVAAAANASSGLIVVYREIANTHVIDTIYKNARILLVRDGTLSDLNAGQRFEMPQNSILRVSHTRYDITKLFANAVRVMNCGSPWVAQKTYKYAMRKAVLDHTKTCQRERIFMTGRLVFEEVQINTSDLTFINRIHERR